MPIRFLLIRRAATTFNEIVRFALTEIQLSHKLLSVIDGELTCRLSRALLARSFCRRYLAVDGNGKVTHNRGSLLCCVWGPARVGHNRGSLRGSHAGLITWVTCSKKGIAQRTLLAGFALFVHLWKPPAPAAASADPEEREYMQNNFQSHVYWEWQRSGPRLLHAPPAAPRSKTKGEASHVSAIRSVVAVEV